MYLYHYPDIWYDYATWHAKIGSIDAAIKIFQRALKALPGISLSFCLSTFQKFQAYFHSVTLSSTLQTHFSCQFLSPDSELLKYAYAELEESHGAILVSKL